MARKAEEVGVNLDSIGSFPEYWQQKRLDEVCKLVTDGTHDSPKETENGFPLVTGKSIKGRNIDFSSAYNISREDHLKVIARSKAERHDLLFANIGNSIGDLVRVNTDRDFSIKNLALFKPDLGVVHPRYLEYYFFSTRVQSYIKNSTRGSAQPFIGLASLRAFPVAVPPMEEQKYIAKLLGDIDDKISINTETNQTLEQMAQAIFKSWFVDFDPVKAKMNGEQPEGMDAAAAALFPDKLVESELGLIPEGWEIKPIKDLCSKVQNGGTPKRSESSYWDDGDIPWLTSGEVRQSIITSVENRITQLGLDKSSAKWVPELSTLVALYGATAGEVSLTSIPLTTNQAVCALMPKKEHQWYNYLQLKSRVAELAGKAVGSAQQNISKGLVESTEVLSVPESLLEAFNAQVENLFKLRICNLQESVELANLRDTLLPKLLSGEIELGETEEMAEVN